MGLGHFLGCGCSRGESGSSGMSESVFSATCAHQVAALLFVGVDVLGWGVPEVLNSQSRVTNAHHMADLVPGGIVRCMLGQGWAREKATAVWQLWLAECEVLRSLHSCSVATRRVGSSARSARLQQTASGLCCRSSCSDGNRLWHTRNAAAAGTSSHCVQPVHGSAPPLGMFWGGGVCLRRRHTLTPAGGAGPWRPQACTVALEKQDATLGKPRGSAARGPPAARTAGSKAELDT